MDELVRRLFGVLHISLPEEKERAVIQFIKFGIVGVSNTILSYLINVAALLVLAPFHISWDYFAANIIAFILSVAWSFFWNNKYVFKARDGEKRNIWTALAKTYVSYAVTGLLLANILSYIWIDLIGISKYIAPLLNLVISVPVNFLLNKLWAFKA